MNAVIHTLMCLCSSVCVFVEVRTALPATRNASLEDILVVILVFSAKRIRIQMCLLVTLPEMVFIFYYHLCKHTLYLEY